MIKVEDNRKKSRCLEVDNDFFFSVLWVEHQFSHSNDFLDPTLKTRFLKRRIKLRTFAW